MIRTFLIRYAIVGVKTKRGKDENRDKFGVDLYTKFNDEIKSWIKHEEKIEVKEKKVGGIHRRKLRIANAHYTPTYISRLI